MIYGSSINRVARSYYTCSSNNRVFLRGWSLPVESSFAVSRRRTMIASKGIVGKSCTCMHGRWKLSGNRFRGLDLWVTFTV